jgi:hypothetical protein
LAAERRSVLETSGSARKTATALAPFFKKYMRKQESDETLDTRYFAASWRRSPDRQAAVVRLVADVPALAASAHGGRRIVPAAPHRKHAYGSARKPLKPSRPSEDGQSRRSPADRRRGA